MKQITDKEYNELLHDKMLVESLYDAGVDNWDGWDIAMDILIKKMKQEDKEEKKWQK